MDVQWVWSGGQLDRGQAESRLGGKAAVLRRLRRLGHPVPPFYVATSQAFRAVVRGERGGRRLDEQLSAAASLGHNQLRRAASDLRRLIEHLPLAPELEEAVKTAHEKLFPNRPVVAVRSSAVGEDGAGRSFAGMHDTLLGLRSLEEILEAVKRVWASAFSDRAITYRVSLGIPLTGVEMAVIIQAMIAAEQSGVVFTCDPNTGNPHVACVSAVRGRGEDLVAGRLPGHTWHVDKATLQIRTPAPDASPLTLALSPLQNAAGGEGTPPPNLLGETTRPEALREAPPNRLFSLNSEPLNTEHSPLAAAGPLNEAQLQSVVQASIAIERVFRRPQDIEFCFDRRQKLFILQARCVTTATEYGPAAGHHLVWDNSNIIESYSGVTSPMTFSFIRRAYCVVYGCFAEVMGVSSRTIRENRAVFENMLGLFRGRVYYNLKSWYALVRLFPGYQWNRRFMETMMGVKQSLTLEGGQPQAGLFRRWLVEFPSLVRLTFRSLRNFLRIERLVAQFQRRFEAHYKRLAATDFDDMAPHELMALYSRMEDVLLRDWKAPIINDFFVMVFFGVLRQLAVSWCGDSSGTLHNGLLCGEGGLESVKPAQMLMRLAQMARQDAELKRVILEAPLESLPQTIASAPQFSGFSQELKRYLDRYGLRCAHELKLEEQSWRDRPQLLF